MASDNIQIKAVIMDIKFSIIIPHRNIPHLLKRCVSSIPHRSDTQIIVVDDYSNDNETYLSKYDFLKAPNIEFCLNDNKQGAGNSRNVGLKYALGKWILFADSDDFFTKNIGVILDKYADINADLVYFKVDSVYSDSLEPADRHVVYNSKLVNAKQRQDIDSFIYSTNSPWAKLISHDLIKKFNITFENIPVSNDAYFSMSCAVNANKILIDDENPLYVITKRAGSLDYSVNKELDDVRLECSYRINELLYKHGKGKYRRNLFGISNRLVWKWEYVIQYKYHLCYLLSDLVHVIYGKCLRAIKRL